VIGRFDQEGVERARARDLGVEGLGDFARLELAVARRREWRRCRVW
jgi:hypothetical protein